MGSNTSVLRPDIWSLQICQKSGLLEAIVGRQFFPELGISAVHGFLEDSNHSCNWNKIAMFFFSFSWYGYDSIKNSVKKTKLSLYPCRFIFIAALFKSRVTCSIRWKHLFIDWIHGKGVTKKERGNTTAVVFYLHIRQSSCLCIICQFFFTSPITWPPFFSSPEDGAPTRRRHTNKQTDKTAHKNFCISARYTADFPEVWFKANNENHNTNTHRDTHNKVGKKNKLYKKCECCILCKSHTNSK